VAQLVSAQDQLAVWLLMALLLQLATSRSSMLCPGISKKHCAQLSQFLLAISGELKHHVFRADGGFVESAHSMPPFRPVNTTLKGSLRRTSSLVDSLRSDLQDVQLHDFRPGFPGSSGFCSSGTQSIPPIEKGNVGSMSCCCKSGPITCTACLRLFHAHDSDSRALVS